MNINMLIRFSTHRFKLLCVAVGACVSLGYGDLSHAANDAQTAAATAEQTMTTASAPVFANFEAALKGLSAESLADKQAAIEQMVTFNQPSTEPILSALVNGKLYLDGTQYLVAQGEGNSLEFYLASDTSQRAEA